MNNMTAGMWIFDVTPTGQRAWRGEDYRKKLWIEKAVKRTDDERMILCLFNELEAIEKRASSHYQNTFSYGDK